ncbi:MAG: efflux RND transporter periplasmic adaptor subunit [Gammaproteobacteria bacterium]|nr:efflux RND transporter periplasmic adaptor subunit [Gammaproteobacteria bacterium]
MKQLLKASLVSISLALALNATAQGQGGLPAEVIKVGPQSLKNTINSIGSLKANQSVVLAPEMSGRVSIIGFEDGSAVSKGKTLFKLDDSTQKAQLNEARARVKLSNTEYKRIKKLFNQKAASETDLDSASANLSINQAQAQYAEAQLEKLTIKAPFDGMIGLHDISVGDYVNAGQSLVNLVQLDVLKFDFSLPETHLSKVKVGQNIEITTPAFPEKIYTGTVTAIAPAINEQTRSFSVRALIKNESLELRPGLFASVNLEVSKNDEALLVPEQALIPQGQQYFVMTVVDGKVAQTPVTIGQRRKSEVELTSGVKIGDIVIIAGQIKLRPGAPVTPLFPEMLQANNQ